MEIANGWKLLLTVVRYSFLLNVTGLLNLNLKYINEFRLRQYSTPSVTDMFKVRTMHQINSK